ncbi:MAG TPA: 50S ribosomal protein L11 methyltransferase [Ktedonobacterales bacterium]
MPTTWIELSVTCDPEAVEAVAELFSRYVEGGVAIEEPYTLHDDGQAHLPLPGAPVTVRAYVPDDAAGADCRVRVQEGLWYLGRIDVGKVGELATRRLAEEDWANAWKEFYHVTHLGARTVIKPSWREYDAQPGEVVIELDPGMAFGTGLHPTTRGCLALLERAVRPGDRVLDVGTGSGILALAAAQLGAAHVLALDVSEVAVAATRANAAANALGERISVRHATLEGAAGEPYMPLPPGLETLGAAVGQFDLVLANIIARVIAQLAPALMRAVRPGGALIASGIIAERLEEAEGPLRAAGLLEVERHQEGDWVTLFGRRAG